MDRQIEPLSQAGVVVYLILICREPGNAAVADLLVHPRYDRKAGTNRITAFNTGTEEGRAWLSALVGFLAARYSGVEGPHGRVWGYIVGNEVNSHWWWYNLGRAPLEEVAKEYEAAVRIVHTAVRLASAQARVYLSFDHHWTIRYAAGAPDQGVPGRALLDAFAKRARDGGDFDWHVAYHPYPEDLTNPRFWNDRTALPTAETPRITFKNLAVLTDYLKRPELLWQGRPRRVILSEQGFNCVEARPEGEREQAAAFAYAWKLVARNPGIDAFILHRHVDHAHEGLNLGLWTHAPDTVFTPGRKRMMYEVFRAAGTPEEEAAFAFALPMVGLGSWEGGGRQPSRAARCR
jgi:hypothetical protein